MSEFADMMAEGLADASEAIGQKSFTIAGIADSFEGVLDSQRGSRALRDGDDGGGYAGDYSAQIVAPLPQFSEVPGPLDITLDNKRLTIGTRVYRIADVIVDSISVTLSLANPNANKR